MGKKRTEIRQDSEGCADRIIYMIIIGFYIGEKEMDVYIHKKVPLSFGDSALLQLCVFK